MNLKLLLAACCCLVAAVQARPSKPATSSGPAGACALTCVSRTFWTGYQVGSVYTYEFEQSVKLSTDLSSGQASRLRIGGLAKLEVHNDCEMALTVEVKDAQVADDVASRSDADAAYSARDPPAKVLQALRQPLRFAFENGRVTQLCPSAEETRASLNLKRGLLSQLQVSVEQRGQSHQLEERDILGDCWTEYTPEGPNTLLKTKDLARCKLNYQTYPLTGVKSFDDEIVRQKHPLTQGSLKCRIEIDAERDIVKETACVEEQTQSGRVGSDAGVQETVRTTTKLALKSESSGLATALLEVQERTDLRHAHKTSGQCHSATAWAEEDLFHSGNECLERSHDAKTSAEAKAEAKRTLEELCHETKADQGMSRDSPKKYADLIKYMRGITEQEHFNELYKLVQDGFCSENPLLKTILRSAIPTVGTKQSVSLIVQLLEKDEVDAKSRGNWLINGIAMMQHPTPEILPQMLNYLRKRREDTMMGVTRDEPLALSAVVHKICQEMPGDCQADPKVKAVVDYFSESIGPACERLATDPDNAFAALLSIGNMGQVAGGAAALVRCAANDRLPTFQRAFALHSLRRFNNVSTEAQDQLVDLMLNPAVDAELRIVAYQTLSRRGFAKAASRLLDAVRRLLDNAADDRQVQAFVFTHLQGLQGEAARLTAPLLRAAKTAGELKKLSVRQYSSSQKFQYFSRALGAGAQAQVPIIFTAQSAIPRYLGLNLTVDLPSRGQSINIMEIGLRMQGLESLMEKLYSRIAGKFSKSTEEQQQPQQPQQQQEQHQSELTPEQRTLQQTPIQPRIDLLYRQYGAELSHTDFSDKFLESLTDVSSSPTGSIASLLMPKKVSGDAPLGASAGTQAESTLAIPTIAGLPILVKQEIHYLTNVRLSESVSGAESSLELRPAAAVVMSRTVAVDAIFERAGIQSSTSFLTSTGLRLSLTSDFTDSSDQKFAFKVEPLVKKQTVADAKTEVNFFQHTAGQAHIEKPLAPPQASVKREKCVEGLAEELIGHKACYKAEYLPGCKKSAASIAQCPGSYQIFLEKNVNFGAYEVSFSLKNQPETKKLQVLIGDKNSSNRLLMFNVQSLTLGDKTNYRLELRNPIFPIIMDSNFTQTSEDYKVKSELQVGTVEYWASGSVKVQPENGIKIDGEFHPKDKAEQKVKVSLEHKFDGLSPMLLLPMATTKLQAVMHTGSQLTAEYQLQQETSKFVWRMSSQYKAAKGDVTSVRYRVEATSSDEEGQKTIRTFLYDLDVQNPSGKNLVHSLHAKASRLTLAEGKQTSVAISHKLQYGAEKKASPVDFEGRLTVKEDASAATDRRQLFKATGSGEFTYYRGGRPVAIKVEDLVAQLGEAADETDGFDKQFTYALSYGIKFQETSAKYQVELRHLDWQRWNLAQQAIELKAKAQLGSISYDAHLKHALNGEKVKSQQIVKLEYYEKVYFHLDHKLSKAEGADTIRHELFLQDARGNKVQAKCGLAWPAAGTMTSDTVVEVNGQRKFGLKQTSRYIETSSDRQVKMELNIQLPSDSYTMETDTKMSRQSVQDLASLLRYQARLIYGPYYADRSLNLLGNFLRQLRLEQSSKIARSEPSMSVILENSIDVNKPNGVFWRHQLRVIDESKDVKNYALAISKKLESEDSTLRSAESIGVQADVTVMDQYLKTDMKARIEYSARGNIYRKASVGASSTKLHLSAAVKLEGEINEMPITSGVNITHGTSWQEEKNKVETYTIITVISPDSKAELNLNATLAPVEVSTSMSLTSNFGLIPFKELKAKAEFKNAEDVSFDTKTEIDGTRIASATFKITKDVLIVDLQTAHPQFQEAGIKVIINSEDMQAIKYNGIFKFIGLSRSMQMKEAGTVTVAYNSAERSQLLGMTSQMEFEGFEDLISYKKLEYEVMLKKKAGVQFQFVASVSSQDHTATKEPMVYLTSTINYWPFKAELKFKANNYKGWQVKYGGLAEASGKSAFLGVEFNDREAEATYEIQDQSDDVKRVNFRVKCDFCVNNGRDLLSGQANMTWPLRPSEFEIGMDMQVNSPMLQRITVRFVHTPAKKNILATFVWNGSTQKLIDCSYSQASVEGGISGDVKLLGDLRFFLGEMARAKVQANYQYGKDKELGFALTMADSDQEVLQGRAFWLAAARSFDSIPVADVDRGLQLKGLGLDAYAVHSTKSDKSSCEWRLMVKLSALSSPITASVELAADGKLKSGRVGILEREFVLTSNPDGSVQATLSGSGSDDANTIKVKWSGSYESQRDMSGKLEIEADGRANIFEAKIQLKQAVFKYGKSGAPNELKIEYENADITTGLWDTTADLTISHETNSENSELTLAPGYRVPMPATRYPFKLVASTKAGIRMLTISFETTSQSVKSMYYKHDFTSFPQSFSVDSNLVGAEAASKIWEMRINVDRNAPSAELKCQIGDKFKASFKEPNFQVQLKNVIDLIIRFPKFLAGSDDSDKKELAIQVALPVLKINEPISLKATLQSLAEGQQVEVKYGRGDDDQIVWSMTARKVNLTPRFDIDLETSLTCKDGLQLGNWQLRSVEGRLMTSAEKSSDRYTITYKDNIRVNGEDWTTTEGRLDGKSGSLPSKGEMTVAGKLECALKFDFTDAEKPVKISASVDKLGDSRDKYSLKLSVSPMKPDSWFPDFQMETECPHRQFVIGKESKKTDSENRVAVELYLNKRQNQGVTVVFKSESLASGVPKYTVEVDLPTRKIRAVCQPEAADKKLGVMITFAWDAEKSPEKALALDARVDFRSNVQAVLECKAPFLRNRVRLEGSIDYTEAGYSAELKHLNGNSEALAVKAEYSYENQAQKDVARLRLEATGAVEAKVSLTVQSREDTAAAEYSSYGYFNSGRKFDGKLKIEAYSVEKNIKFVYRPLREITVSCDHGASLSVKYTTESRQLCQLTVFVSGNDKSAAKLKLVYSRPAGRLTAKLDVGSGSFSHSAADLSVLTYRPEKVLLRATIGDAAASDQKLHAAVYIGQMTVGQKLSAFEAAAVPGHLVFFSAGLRFDRGSSGSNKLKYSVNWRTLDQDKMNFAIDWMRSALRDYKTAAASALNTLSSVRLGSVASNVDALWIAEELGNIAANDYDQLERYLSNAVIKNEFYLRNILNGAGVVRRIAERWFAAAAKTASSFVEYLSKLNAMEWIANLAQKAAIELADRINFKSAWEAIVECFETTKDFADYWMAKANELISSFVNWLSSIVPTSLWTSNVSLSELADQAGDYLDNLSPITRAAKENTVQLCRQAADIAKACLAGLRSLAYDDLLPLAMNHLEDAKAAKEFYDNVAFQLRLWYDSGATPKEREALSRTSQLLSYIWSEGTVNNWRKLTDAFRRVLDGQLSTAFYQLVGESRVDVWLPECNAECQRGGAPAALEGSLDSPIYPLADADNWRNAARLAWRAPRTVLKRVAAKLRLSGPPDAVSVVAAAALGWHWDPITRLLTIRHRTAVLAGGNHLVTFDGLALTHQRPCSYLVARDFLRGDFSVVQEYRRVSAGGAQARGDLRVRFGDLRVTVKSNNAAVRLDDRPASLPLKKTSATSGKSVEASRTAGSDLLTVRFHGNSLRDILVLRCSPSTDSCVISVHPLYQGRVRGLAGSNNGRHGDDIHTGEAVDHVKFWTAGECLAEAGGAPSVVRADDDSASDSDCRAWFGRSQDENDDSKSADLAACFDAVDPRPFRGICQRASGQAERCQSVRQYAQRCRSEGVRVSEPAQCVDCRLGGKQIPTGEAQQVTDAAALRERLQVVFLVEDSACGRQSVGGRGAGRIARLAQLIANAKDTVRGVRKIEFGLAHYGSSDSASLTSIPMGDDEEQKQQRFGSIADLTAALAQLGLTGSGSDTDEESTDVLKAIADLPSHYQWEPMAQKHIVVISCKPCSSGADNYAQLFAKAQQSVKDQVFVHTISKRAIKSLGSMPDILGFDAKLIHDTDAVSHARRETDSTFDRSYTAECSAELAVESDTKAKGSVWRQDQFTDESQIGQMLVSKELLPKLRNPSCLRCSCSKNTGTASFWWKKQQPQQHQQQQQQQPICKIVSCAEN